MKSVDVLASPHKLHCLLQGVGRVTAGVQHHGPEAEVGQDPLVRVYLYMIFGCQCFSGERDGGHPVPSQMAYLVQGVEHGLHPLTKLE